MELSQDSLEVSRDLILKRQIKITIAGLGKMGLPLCAVFTNSGFSVTGYDVSETVISNIKQKKFQIDEPGVSERLSKSLDLDLFMVTTDKDVAFREADFVIIIIPVLTDDNGFADITNLIKLYEDIAEFATNNPIVIQESTLPPGTTSGVLKEVFTKLSKRSGSDFGLVFAPERTFSGRAIADIEERYPKIIGADTQNVSLLTKVLYEQVAKKGVIEVSNTSTAEAVKTFKGAYRDANIAIANELAILADQFGIDIIEVINAANTEPFSHIHTPGIGVGGHCIPVYPRFLIAQSSKFPYKSQILSSSRKINDFMVSYCIEQLEGFFDLKNKNIIVLGLAYRGGVKEPRNSPTLRLVPELKAIGAKVKVSDHLFSHEEIDSIFGLGSAWEFNKSELFLFDVIIITADHREYNGLEEHIGDTLVYDGRYVLDPKKGRILQPGRKLLFNQN